MLLDENTVRGFVFSWTDPDANVIFSLRLDAVESDDLRVLIIAAALEIDK